LDSLHNPSSGVSVSPSGWARAGVMGGVSGKFDGLSGMADRLVPTFEDSRVALRATEKSESR